MNISFEAINSFLIENDIEGLIEIGAPLNEYELEAHEISACLEALPFEELTPENVTSIIIKIWMNSFIRDESDMQLRIPVVQQITKKIMMK